MISGTVLKRPGLSLLPIMSASTVLAAPRLHRSASAATFTADADSVPFVHPGLFNTDADSARIRAKLAAGTSPWTAAYAALTSDWTGHQTDWTPHPSAVVYRGNDGTHAENFATFANDVAVAYASALRWKISGDTAYADHALRILNAWGTTLIAIRGDPNFQLIDISGYQFANAAEIMRTYSGWAAADFVTFKTMMRNVFYPSAHDFLIRHMGQAYSYMWANWDLRTMDCIYALGVLCDDHSLTAEATDYFYNGLGEGNIERTVYVMHPGYLGQTQESGRDQGHNTLEIALLAPLCQMAWNQGVDLYGDDNNRVLAGAEYVAKYNLGNDVPFVTYANETGYPSYAYNTEISADGRGSARPGWELIYNHYVNVEGLAAPYSAAFAAELRPTGYAGQDQPGFDTLTASRVPIATGANPSGLTATVAAQQPVLSWWGSAYALGYNVMRATSSGGPYTTVVTGLTDVTYADTSRTAGVTYYYVVTAVNVVGESAVSNEANAAPSDLLLQLNLDELSGSLATDTSGNGLNGAANNGTAWTPGQSNGSASLDGSDDYISEPMGVVSSLSDFTVSTWVKRSGGAAWQRIFDLGSGSNVYMFLTPSAGTGGPVRFAIRTASTSGQAISGTATLPIGTWAHVAVSVTGSTGKLYVNGVQVGTNSAMTLKPSSLGATTQNWIGRSQFSADRYFTGQVDDVRIYSRVLSAALIRTLANTAAPTVPTSVTAKIGDSELSLNWAASFGATAYAVAHSTSSAGPYLTIGSGITATDFIDSNVVNGTTYYYAVTATRGTQQSSTSTPVSASPAVTASTPKVVTAAATANTTLSGTNVAISVLGSDDGGESNFTYTLFTDGAAPAPVSFSVNRTNSAKNNVATFTKAGTYHLIVRIADTSGNFVSSRLTIFVAADQFDAGFEYPSQGASYAYTPAGSQSVFAGRAGIAADGSAFGVGSVKGPNVLNPALAGWTFTNSAGVAADGSAYNVGTGHGGTQVAILQSNLGKMPSMSQSVQFGDAGSYKISFSAAQRIRANNTQGLQVLVDGVAIYTVTPGATTFTTYATPSFNITTPGTHVISFAGTAVTTATSGDHIAFVDDVVLQADPLAPTLSAVQINDGTVQRSMVKSLTMSFSQAVTLDSGAVTLATHSSLSGATGIIPSYTWATPDGGYTYIVTFSGNGVTGGSISDGNYELTLHANLLKSSVGVSMSTDQTASFFRLYGDIDGDRGVSINDFNVLANAFSKTAGQTGFVAALDYDGDGGISISDFNAFATRFGSTI